ncbi:hypothetical protein L1281_001923 [Neisseria sp. HSC-16F19]|nr:hypothetical protein [Neisseria sp. HSC-16F19]MCP2041325.1 hypothetical protein [Neisseria sp. HSC-16F19]
MQKILVSAAALMLLAACGTTSAPRQAQQGGQQQAPVEEVAISTDTGMQLARVDSIDGRVEVAYTCDSRNGKQKVRVMYGVKDGTLVVAQTLINNEPSPGLYRVLNDANGDTQNSYFGEGITWTTAKATPANVTKVNGNMLTQAGTDTVNGKQVQVDNILLKSCVLDKAATAKLNKK